MPNKTPEMEMRVCLLVHALTVTGVRASTCRVRLCACGWGSGSVVCRWVYALDALNDRLMAKEMRASVIRFRVCACACVFGWVRVEWGVSMTGRLHE